MNCEQATAAHGPRRPHRTLAHPVVHHAAFAAYSDACEAVSTGRAVHTVGVGRKFLCAAGCWAVAICVCGHCRGSLCVQVQDTPALQVLVALAIDSAARLGQRVTKLQGDVPILQVIYSRGIYRAYIGQASQRCSIPTRVKGCGDVASSGRQPPPLALATCLPPGQTSRPARSNARLPVARAGAVDAIPVAG